IEKDSAKHRGKITPPQDFRQWASFSTATGIITSYLKLGHSFKSRQIRPHPPIILHTVRLAHCGAWALSVDR
ncbi:MAG: hypothetical protein WB723_01150, partial [Candidatus Acidiferrales bacterium]